MRYKEVLERLEGYDKRNIIIKNQILVGKMEKYSVFVKGGQYDIRVFDINKSQFNKLKDLGYEWDVTIMR